MASRRRGTVLLRVSAQGAGPLARDFDRAAREMQDTLLRELRGVAVRGLERLREQAPVDSGDLRSQIRPVEYARASQPRISFIADTRPGHAGAEDGYPYVAVTRFGHRKARIYARPGSILTVHEPGRQAIESRRQSVRGVRVSRDWVADAERGVDRQVSLAEQRIVRGVERTLGGGRIR